MDHSPPLLPQFPDFIEDGDALVVAHQQPDKAKRDKSASSTHSSAAVHYGGLALAQTLQKGIDKKIKRLSPLLARHISIWPISQLVMINHPRLISLSILELEALEFERFLMRHLFLLEKGDLILLLQQGRGMGILLRVVAVTLDFVLFDEGAQHEDSRHVVVLDHAPKVMETIGKRSLSGNAMLSFEFNHIGIDIILHFFILFALSESCAGGIKGHEAWIAIKGELFWIFIEFIHMVLCLCHEAKQFELCCQATLQTLKSKVDLRNLLTHLTQVLILSLPLLRNVVVHGKVILLIGWLNQMSARKPRNAGGASKEASAMGRQAIYELSLKQKQCYQH